MQQGMVREMCDSRITVKQEGVGSCCLEAIVGCFRSNETRFAPIQRSRYATCWPNSSMQSESAIVRCTSARACLAVFATLATAAARAHAQGVWQAV